MSFGRDLFLTVGNKLENCLKFQTTNSRIDKDAANEIALKHLIRSVQLDDNDHLALYYLALQYMHLGMLNEAMVTIQHVPITNVFMCRPAGRYPLLVHSEGPDVTTRSVCYNPNVTVHSKIQIIVMRNFNAYR